MPVGTYRRPTNRSTRSTLSGGVELLNPPLSMMPSLGPTSIRGVPPAPDRPEGLCGDRSMRGKRGGRSLVETDAPDEMFREIEARLGVRRRFYEQALVVFALVEVGISAPAAWLNPTLSGYILAGCASAILGTAVVAWWAYKVRESALYERAGRTLLRNR